MNIFRELGIREGKDRLNEEVLYNAARVYSLTDRLVSDLLRRYGLSPAKFNILLMIKHIGKEKGMSQNEVSRLLLVTTSNITRMIDKLEKSKYVERSSQRGDRRVNLLKITKEGSDLLDKIWPVYKELVDGLVGKNLNKEERKHMNSLLEKFVAGVK